MSVIVSASQMSQRQFQQKLNITAPLSLCTAASSVCKGGAVVNIAFPYSCYLGQIREDNPNICSSVLFPVTIICRPGQSQGLLYTHCWNSIIRSLTHPLPLSNLWWGCKDIRGRLERSYLFVRQITGFRWGMGLPRVLAPVALASLSQNQLLNLSFLLFVFLTLGVAYNLTMSWLRLNKYIYKMPDWNSQ